MSKRDRTHELATVSTIDGKFGLCVCGFGKNVHFFLWWYAFRFYNDTEAEHQ